MGKSLMHETRAVFDATLKRLFPDFRAVKAELPPGWRAYRALRGRLSVFIVFAPRSYESHFTVEVGWSDSDVLPTVLATRLLPDPEGRWQPIELPDGGARFRLTEFVPRPNGIFELEWDVVTGKRCAERHIESPRNVNASYAAECVEDALLMVREFAIPFILKRTGVEDSVDSVPGVKSRRDGAKRDR